MEGSRTPVESEDKPLRLVILNESECLDGIQVIAAILAGNDPGEQLRRPMLRGSLSSLLATLRRAYNDMATAEALPAEPPAEEVKKGKSSPKGK